MNDSLTKIGVFYDGNYFLHVSNYYNYDHARRARLSIAGLHRFIEARVANAEGRPGMAKIVDSHYFRGRLSAQEAQQRGTVLYYDRVFDDILMSSGVTTHYSPIRSNHGRRTEKGIDVWFALEAYESALLRKLDVVVLIASDSDYVPLVRKLQALGCRVVILGWDFEFTTDNGSQMITRTSQDLLEEASHPILMNHIIDDPRSASERDLVDNLFVVGNSDKKRRKSTSDHSTEHAEDDDVELEQPTEGNIGDRMEGEIFSLKNGYGFIKYPPNNLFFHHTTLENADFSELYVNDHVAFTLAHSDRGQLIAIDVKLLEEFEQE
ncbi:NYN domain-containing protein [Neolewinella lacunae]|uniref:NYN domain-containing protein n=1 Tax=Neolewinella lacunae TaxID=1517758 RepID=A0A923PJ35_9BACT|nr:NYN domain-containing protein [Neolewinella lacunae]MBC6993515.1 NYN domain-containing protein [Neolewinella lacunae]MDN3636209.1 NYN domain-containing protein [Neolewinella lacunae]